MAYCINDRMSDNTVTSKIDYGHFSLMNLAQDLSGSLSGAGGIGGLISVTRNTSSGTSIYYPLADANGNISDYVDANGNVVAHREFDAYGNTIVSSGAVNDFNFWFSTKYYDAEINAYYFGYREYLVELARWGSRDPIEEESFNRNLLFDAILSFGQNLYGYCGNEPNARFDVLGLEWNIIRDSSNPWAVAIPKEDTDTFKTLASDKIFMEYSERTKWLKWGSGFVSDSDKAKKGCRYGVPNTIVVYTTKSFDWKDDSSFSATELSRGLAVASAAVYSEQHFKIVYYLNQDHRSDLIKAWKQDGIRGFIFGGHGVLEFGKYGLQGQKDDGYITSASSVNSEQVHPPYKLVNIILYACSSAKGSWKKDHLSSSPYAYFIGATKNYTGWDMLTTSYLALFPVVYGNE